MAYAGTYGNVTSFQGTAGVGGVVAGNLVYRDSATGTYLPASNAASATAAIAGMALNTAPATAPIDIATSGDINWTGLTAGNVLIVSTAGAFTAGNAGATTYPALVGLAVSTTKLRLAITVHDGSPA
jgi:hypothetical protein